MAGSTSKRVIVRRFDREPIAGFVNPRTFLQPSGVEVLAQSGTVSVIPFAEIKAVCFVRDFEDADEPAGSRLFQARPKTEGLWVRMRFLDNDLMDGLLPNNLLQLDSFGFTVTPPNPSSNNQRVFVPRSSLSEIHVLGVVGSPLRPRKRAKAPRAQLEMFE